MAKNHYGTLGVEPDATLDQIKSAYRKKAKRCHPDRTQRGSEPFLDIKEAYDVLCDAGRRQAYDEKLARERARLRRAATQVRPQSYRQRRSPVEPLVPSPGTGGFRDAAPVHPVQSLFEELVGHLSRSSRAATGPGVWQERGDVHLQVSLTLDEALHGGRIRLRIPVQTRCPACRGRETSGFVECPYCYGRGVVVGERPVDITFPGGLADGDEARVSLGPSSPYARHLVLHFRLDEW